MDKELDEHLEHMPAEQSIMLEDDGKADNDQFKDSKSPHIKNNSSYDDVHKLMPNCVEKPVTELKVDLNLSYMKAIFIHPENHTYPIFSVELNTLKLNYDKKCDHDEIKTQIKNF